MSLSPLDLGDWARRLRLLANEKYPQEEPLIVRTGIYDDIAHHLEKNIAVVRAPYGSGKTTGIAMKLYHDARLGRYPAASSTVIAVKAREALENLEWFNNYVKADTNRVLCGSLYLTLIKLAVHEDKCYDRRDTSCYSTLSQEDRSLLKQVFEADRALVTAERCPRPEYLVNALDRITEAFDRKMYLVVDELEGFAERLGTGSPSLVDLIKAHLAMARILYDHNLRNIKLILLVQSKVIAKGWEEIIKYVEDWRPGLDVECSCGGNYRISAGSAVAGVSQIITLEYYNSAVYTEYVEELFRRLAGRPQSSSAKRTLKRIIEEVSEKARVLEDKLSFLEQMAPRIAFDYADDIATRLLNHMIGGKKFDQALEEALREVTRTWKTHSGLRRYYAYLVSSDGDLFEGSKALLKPPDVELIVGNFLEGITGGMNCVRETTRYYSLYGGVAFCREPGDEAKALLVFFRPSIHPLRSAKNTRLNNRFKGLLANIVRVALEAHGKIHHININGVVIVREKSRPETSSTLQQAMNEVLLRIRKDLPREVNLKNLNIRIPLYPITLKMKDEDLIILYLRGHPESLSFEEKRFVEERFSDIISKAKTKINL